jgi:hypothetical protein
MASRRFSGWPRLMTRLSRRVSEVPLAQGVPFLVAGPAPARSSKQSNSALGGGMTAGNRRCPVGNFRPVRMYQMSLGCLRPGEDEGRYFYEPASVARQNRRP